MNTPPHRLLGTALLLAAAGTAHAAPIYDYSVENLPLEQSGNPGINSNGGYVSSIDASYDAGAETFTWSYTSTADNDGFWLVVSDGENPKGNVNEYAILYGDIDKNRVTAYVYNGQNNSDSLTSPNVFLGSFENAFDLTPLVNPAPPPGTGPLVLAPVPPTRTASFTIDVSAINNAQRSEITGLAGMTDWDGVEFGSNVGIWFHATRGTEFAYDNENGASGVGAITSYSRQGAGWFDGADFATTTRVPEPSVLYLSGMGLFAFSLSRRFSGKRRVTGQGVPRA